MHRSSGFFRRQVAASCALLALTGAASAVEVTVQNDSHVSGGPLAVQTGFVAGESAAAWLTSPCDGNIVAVQVAWWSLTNSEPPSIEDSITIHLGGNFPVPGSVAAELVAPLMTPGALNEFRWIDEQMTIPISIPVSEGDTFVVAFQFSSSPVPLIGPSVTTDVDGCQNQRNAIFCVGGGCAGWVNACALGVSGDFMIRAVVDCESVSGACCLTTGQCVVDTQANCLAANGDYQGDQVSCGQVVCEVPEEACCFTDPFPQCFLLTSEDCLVAEGTPQGAGTDCKVISCEPPQGACCFEPSGCVDLNETDCQTAQGTWSGEGTNCGSFTCNPTGACCLADGGCTDATPQSDCRSAGGVFQGDASLCSGVSCPQPVGACCISNGGCIENLEETVCKSIPTSIAWGGAGSDCQDIDQDGTADACQTGCVGCVEDCDGSNDGMVTVLDLLALLSNWNGPGACDIQPADPACGDDVIDVVDLLALLGKWGACR